MTFKLMYNIDHLKAHQDGLSVDVEILIKAAKNALKYTTKRSERVGIQQYVFAKTRTYGFEGIFPSQQGVWGYRKGRNRLSRFTFEPINKQIPVYGICIVGQWINPDRFKLFTLFPGDNFGPLEIVDKKFWNQTSEEIERGLKFWEEYAFPREEAEEILDSEESAFIESALTMRDLETLELRVTRNIRKINILSSLILNQFEAKITINTHLTIR